MPLGGAAAKRKARLTVLLLFDYCTESYALVTLPDLKHLEHT